MVASPTYHRPVDFHELGSRVPRLVNPQWLVLALRDNARATAKGEFLPWVPEELLRRAATCIEQHVVQRRPR